MAPVAIALRLFLPLRRFFRTRGWFPLGSSSAHLCLDSFLELVVLVFKDFLEVFRILLDYLQVLPGLLDLPSLAFELLLIGGLPGAPGVLEFI